MGNGASTCEGRHTQDREEEMMLLGETPVEGLLDSLEDTATGGVC